MCFTICAAHRVELRHSWDLIPSAAAANLGGGTQGTQGKPQQIQLFSFQTKHLPGGTVQLRKATAVLCKNFTSEACTTLTLTLGLLGLANLLLDAGQNFFSFTSFFGHNG